MAQDFLSSMSQPLSISSFSIGLTNSYVNFNLYISNPIVLKVCRKPERYDEKLEVAMRPALYIMIIIHIGFAIWIYGNPQVFATGDSQFGQVEDLTEQIEQSEALYYINTFIYRAMRPHNIALTILGVVLIAAALLK